MCQVMGRKKTVSRICNPDIAIKNDKIYSLKNNKEIFYFTSKMKIQNYHKSIALLIVSKLQERVNT